MWKEKPKHGDCKESKRMGLVYLTVLQYKHTQPKKKNK